MFSSALASPGELYAIDTRPEYADAREIAERLAGHLGLPLEDRDQTLA